MVIRRVPPRPEGFDPRPTGTLAMVLVLLVVVGIWLLNGRDPGTGTDPGAQDVPSGAAPVAPSTESGPGGPGGSATDPDSGLPYVEVTDLPREATATLRLIDVGGPFPYGQDGSTFGNFEGLLPDRSRGYYAEYTVDTPGSDDRGARRIVGGDQGELYWTADHYDSFSRIRR